MSDTSSETSDTFLTGISTTISDFVGRFFDLQTWLELLPTGGPIVLALALIYFAHDRLAKFCREVHLSNSPEHRIRFYDRLYAAFWIFIGLLLATGTGTWLKRELLVSGPNIVRGTFTKVEPNVHILADTGRFYFHRKPFQSDLQFFEIDWILTPIDHKSSLAATVFVITEGSLDKEKSLYCKIEFEKAGMSGDRVSEIRFHSEKQILSFPDNESKFPCNPEHIVENDNWDEQSWQDIVLRLPNFSAMAANMVDFDPAIRKYLNSQSVLERLTIRRFLRDEYHQYSELVNELLLDPSSTYQERLGSIWITSRAVTKYGKEVVESAESSEKIWEAVLSAAVDSDEAIRESGKQFVAALDDESTLERVQKFVDSLKDPAKVDFGQYLMGHYYYSRATGKLLTAHDDTSSVDLKAVLKDVSEAQKVLEGIDATDNDDYARTLFVQGWAEAVAAKYGNGSDPDFGEQARVTMRMFLDASAVRSDAYRYQWQKDQAAQYLETSDVDVITGWK